MAAPLTVLTARMGRPGPPPRGGVRLPRGTAASPRLPGRVSARADTDASADSAVQGPAPRDGGEMECAAAGMDSVVCDITVPEGREGGASTSRPDNNSLTDILADPSLDVLAKTLTVGNLVSPFFFWGTSMVVMKSLVPHTSGLFVGAARLIPAGFLLVLWAALDGRKMPSGAKAWGAIALFALIDGAMFQGFLTEGLKTTSAGLGSVIIDSQPLSVALLSAVFLGEQLGGKAVTGLLVGVLGLLLLEVPSDALTGGGSLGGVWIDTIEGRGAGLSEGDAWMLLSAQSMAVGTVMVPWVCRFVDPVMATGWHMVLGGVPLAFLAAREADTLLPALAAISPEDLLGLAYVTVLGGAAGYGIFFYNASKGNLTALSSLTFLTPVFAATAGYFALQETLSPVQLLGASVTLGAVFLINSRQEGEE